MQSRVPRIAEHKPTAFNLASSCGAEAGSDLPPSGQKCGACYKGMVSVLSRQ